MAPRKSAAQRAAEEAEAAEALALDAAGNQEPEPEPEPEPETETDWHQKVAEAEMDALRYDPNRVGAPEPYVHKRWPHAARGRIANQLFDASAELGYPLDVIRSTSDGFRYPENIDRYLFPSEYDG